MSIRERVNEKRIKIQIPKNQIHWVTTFTSDRTPKYAVTSDKMRTKYTLLASTPAMDFLSWRTAGI